MMKQSNKKNRRQFLKNTSLAALSIGLSPIIGKSKPNHPASESLLDCDRTTLDYYGPGPFYTANPPEIMNAQLADIDEPGKRTIISGRILNLDCLEYIPDTIVDIWHADDAGAYDKNGYNLRGKTQSNAQGFYLFETILPGKYLNGSSFRPSHIHFKITPPGFSTLTTQLYFEGDTDIPGDDAASKTDGKFDARARIIPLTLNSEGKYEGVWDIVINGKGIPTNTKDLHIDKGVIYKAFPNPATNQVEIHYGVFKTATAGIEVYNLAGQLVATLEENRLEAEKYNAIWEPDPQLPNGFYFIALKINALQVHYLKVNLVR